MSYDAGSAHADQDPHRNPTTSPGGPARWVGRPKKGNRTARSWVIASDPGRLPAGRQWSRKHAHTQRRLWERFAAR